jgi:hypothetical protein
LLASQTRRIDNVSQDIGQMYWDRYQAEKERSVKGNFVLVGPFLICISGDRPGQSGTSGTVDQDIDPAMLHDPSSHCAFYDGVTSEMHRLGGFGPIPG